MRCYRQGDVLVVTVGELPLEAKAVERDARGCVVLAEGELTGHSHHFAAPQVKQYKTPEGRFYFEIEGEAAPLKHEEHTEISFGPGTYRSARQTEYEPGELRYVAD